MSAKQSNLRFVRVIDLIRKMDRCQQKLFAHDCAERTIPLCQEVVPDIHFLQEQLLTAKNYIDGCIDSDEMHRALEAVNALLRDAKNDYYLAYKQLILIPGQTIVMTSPDEKAAVWRKTNEAYRTIEREYLSPATYALDSVYGALYTAYSEEKYYPEASVSRTARFARKAAGGAEQLWQRKHALALLESNKL